MHRDGYRGLSEETAPGAGCEETEMTSMIPIKVATNGFPPGAGVGKASRGQPKDPAGPKPGSTTTGATEPSGHQTATPGAADLRRHTVCDLSLSVVSSGVANSRLTRETALTASPGRMRNARVAPPLPRRADFGEYYPDGGWGWIVCGAAFTVHFLAHGLHLAFGTLMAEMVAAFSIAPAHTVWLGSTSLAVSLLMAPMVVAVSRRKSTRLLGIVGGLVTALGCLFLSFSSQYHQMLTSYTLVVGLGSGVTLTAASVMVGSYFHKRRECAEMLMLSGSGVGMALVSTFIRQTVAILKWMRGLQALTGLVLPLVAAAALYRSASIYHPRRRAILHLKNLRKTKKQQREFEDKPPYFDWAPLRMRSMQVLMTSCALTALGTFTPFALLGVDASSSVQPTEVVVLMVYMGVALAAGSVLFGLVVIRASLRCMVARQYLCQLAGFGAGLCTMLLPLVSGFHGYVLYVWSFGILYGGYTYTLKVYVCELSSVKLSIRSWGYVGLAQALPALVGAPSSFYMNDASSLPAKSGFIFAGISMVTGSLLLFLMPWASSHRSNHEVIQHAHFHSKTFDDDLLFYGMEISEDVPSHEVNRQQGITASPGLHRRASPATKRQKMAKVQLYSNVRELGGIAEEDHWSEIEAMSPMSPTDKVTEFLLQSQSMLQSYSQVHNLELPTVRLEINNEFAPETSETSDADVAPPSRRGGKQPLVPGITDIKLEATISRISPKRGVHHAANNAVYLKAGNRVTRSHSEPQIWQKQLSANGFTMTTSSGNAVLAPTAMTVAETRQSIATNMFSSKQKTTPV